MNLVYQVLCLALNLFYIVLIVRIILSWVPSLPEPLRPVARVVSALTDPVLNPFRGLLPPVRIGAAALDLSPIILFVILGFLVIPFVCGLGT